MQAKHRTSHHRSSRNDLPERQCRLLLRYCARSTRFWTQLACGSPVEPVTVEEKMYAGGPSKEPSSPYAVEVVAKEPSSPYAIEAVAVDAYAEGSAGFATMSVIQADNGSPARGGTRPLPAEASTTPPVYREPEYEASPVMSPVTIELYENERYSPRLGFCAKGLIIGDRGNFSIADGSWSLASMDEADSQLISRGWQWTSDWQIVGTDAYGTVTQYEPSVAGGEEGGGWLYNSDFASYSTGKTGQPKKGLTHFVRRRKLMRICVFDENSVCNDETHTCKSCSTKSLEQLNNLFLDLFYGALFARYPNKVPVLPKIVKVKSLFVDALMKHSNVRSFSIDHIRSVLTEFATSQQKSRGTLARYKQEDWYCQQVEQHFPLLERFALARATIRKYDTTYEYHCDEQYCGAACPFAVQRCPHVGCEVRFSKRWWAEHDSGCLYKIIPCPHLCDMFIPRNRAQDHRRNSCILRSVSCHYANIGCTPPGLICRDVDAHCNLNAAYHLSLSMAHIQKLSDEKMALQREVRLLRQEAIMGSAVLAGELSLMAALAANQLVNPHMQHNRKPAEAPAAATDGAKASAAGMRKNVSMPELSSTGVKR